MKKFINVNVLGVTSEGQDEIVLFAYGSRGGLRACLSVDLEAAAKLRDDLDKEIKEYAI